MALDPIQYNDDTQKTSEDYKLDEDELGGVGPYSL